MHHREAAGRGTGLALELGRHGIPDSPILVLLSEMLLVICVVRLGQTGVRPLPVAVSGRGYGEQLGSGGCVCVRVCIRVRAGAGSGRLRGGLKSWGL